MRRLSRQPRWNAVHWSRWAHIYSIQKPVNLTSDVKQFIQRSLWEVNKKKPRKIIARKQRKLHRFLHRGWPSRCVKNESNNTKLVKQCNLDCKPRTLKKFVFYKNLIACATDETKLWKLTWVNRGNISDTSATQSKKTNAPTNFCLSVLEFKSYWLINYKCTYLEDRKTLSGRFWIITNWVTLWLTYSTTTFLKTIGQITFLQKVGFPWHWDMWKLFLDWDHCINLPTGIKSMKHIHPYTTLSKWFVDVLLERGTKSPVSVAHLDFAGDSRFVLFISFLLLSRQLQRYH